jgi:hypothetical protein
MVNLSLPQIVFLSLLGLGSILIVAYARAYALAIITATVRSRRNNVISADVTYDPCDDNDQAPDVSHLVADLEDLGFAVRGRWLHASNSQAAADITLLENPRTLDVAKLLEVAAGTRRLVTVLFQCRFEDGTEVATANNPIPAGFPALPGTTGVWLPEVRDPEQLYRVHACVSDHLGEYKKRLSVGRDPVAFLTEAHNRRVAHFVEIGYYYLDKRHGVYRLTWKGAVLITLRLIWPIRPLFQARRRRRTHKILYDLGIQLEAA